MLPAYAMMFLPRILILGMDGLHAAVLLILGTENTIAERQISVHVLVLHGVCSTNVEKVLN